QPAEEAGVYLSRLLCAEPDLDIEPRRTQLLEPLACHARIWILKRNDHSLHARSDQSVDARWSPTPVAARLEADMGHGTGSCFARAPESLGFAVRSASGLGPPPSDDASVIYDNATNCRVRPNGTQPPTSKRQRRSHRLKIQAPIAG